MRIFPPTGDYLGIPENLQYKELDWLIDKSLVYNSIRDIQAGLEYARECLTNHDAAVGRTTSKNISYARTVERDIDRMEYTLSKLKALNPPDRSAADDAAVTEPV